MIPATFKLCAAISYQHLRTATGLRHTAMAALGHKLHHLRLQGQGPSAWVNQVRRRSSLISCRTEEKPYSEAEMAYVKQGEEALHKSISIIQDANGWKTEIEAANGDKVASKMLPDIGKVFKLEVVMDKPSDLLYSELFDKIEHMGEWNPNVKQVKILKKINNETMITHEVSADTAGNIISPRDFVSVRYSKRRGSTCFLSGISTHCDMMPEQNGFIRAENGPTCIVLRPSADDPNKTKFTWLLSIDLKGWLPKSLIDQVLSQSQADFAQHLRRHMDSSTAVPSC
ncbi:steroidogenic acute regulatory protein, mitochondrial [Carcharodon carcharias]|uniref:steroidogenic acute regulatory protein, mitochondrial n=1 Tax=Carcharodon carcharias TaxID=13397 RepID=UPI001B7F541F|nr:steroidogenic acute regulatory protein, mitochondrial [Carcharodon carcharias]